MTAIVVQSLGFLTLVALAAAVVMGFSLALPGRYLTQRLVDATPMVAVGWAWLVAALATAGSLYLSDGVGLEPCKLCWLQRIAMYPLVIVLGVAWLRRDRQVWKTAVPLASIGALISAYHVLIQWRPALEVTECSASAPCSLRYFLVYGFVSIPVMAGAAFLLILALLAHVAGAVPGPENPVRASVDPQAAEDDFIPSTGPINP